MSKPLVKVTEFVGVASGDYECFCFDKRTAKQVSKDEEDQSQKEPYTRSRVMSARRREEKARVYPNSLLPEGSTSTYDPQKGHVPAPRGTWRITVEFEPEEV